MQVGLGGVEKKLADGEQLCSREQQNAIFANLPVLLNFNEVFLDSLEKEWLNFPTKPVLFGRCFVKVHLRSLLVCMDD